MQIKLVMPFYLTGACRTPSNESNRELEPQEQNNQAESLEDMNLVNANRNITAKALLTESLQKKDFF